VQIHTLGALVSRHTVTMWSDEDVTCLRVQVNILDALVSRHTVAMWSDEDVVSTSASEYSRRTCQSSHRYNVE